MLGRRPIATSRCDPAIVWRPDASSTMAAMAVPSCSMPTVRVPRCAVMPSASKIPRTASEISGSSRPISRGAVSITVTSLPNRRYICANSRPT